jgi:hypothetical protein
MISVSEKEYSLERCEPRINKNSAFSLSDGFDGNDSRTMEENRNLLENLLCLFDLLSVVGEGLGVDFKEKSRV